MLAAQEMQRDIDHRVNDQLRLRHMHGFPAGYPYPGMVPPDLAGMPSGHLGHPALHPGLLPGMVPPYPYDPRVMAPGVGGPYNPFLNHLNAYGTHNLELRRMLQVWMQWQMDRSAPPAFPNLLSPFFRSPLPLP